jgi:hypothetical protein
VAVWTSGWNVTGGTSPSAATWNQIGDNFTLLGGNGDPTNHATYGTGASWTSTGTQPAQGNGTWQGLFMQVGGLVCFNASITAGSTTTFGTGQYRFALPVTPINSWVQTHIGGRMQHGGHNYQLFVTVSGGLAFMEYKDVSVIQNTALTATTPVTLVSGDTILVSGTYYAGT